jgi:hypothetical protein
LLLLTSRAPAAESDTARQLAGLFMQSCLAFAGDAPSLRAWARQNGLKELPDPARATFLRGVPGLVFDASNAAGKFVVISADQGSCSAVTNAANGPDAVRALESDLAAAGVRFQQAGERDDEQETKLHYREYAASRNGRAWRILAGTVKDQKAGQAMLTANPN